MTCFSFYTSHIGCGLEQWKKTRGTQQTRIGQRDDDSMERCYHRSEDGAHNINIIGGQGSSGLPEMNCSDMSLDALNCREGLSTSLPCTFV